MSLSEKPKDIQDKVNALQISEFSLKKRFLNLRTLISFTLALAFLVFIFLRLEVNFSATWEAIKSSNPLFYALAYVSYYATFPLRGWRWQLLLRNAGFPREKFGASLSIWRLSDTILIGFFANCILYVKLGDAYRTYLFSEEAKVSFSKTLGTVVAERVLDLVIIFSLLLVGGAGLWVASGKGIAPSLLIIAGGMVLLPLALLAAMWRFGKKLEKHLPPRLKSLYSPFQEGTLGSFRELPLLGALSVGIWLLEAGRLFLVAKTLGFALGIFFLLVVSPAQALLTALPLTPGGLGFVETGLAGLLMLSLPKESAWSITLLDRTISYLSLILFGLVLFLHRQYGQYKKP